MAGSVIRVRSCVCGGIRGAHFHVGNEGSGIVYDNNVGVRVRRMRRFLGPRLRGPFVLTGGGSRGFKRVTILLSRSGKVGGMRTAVHHLLSSRGC